MGYGRFLSFERALMNVDEIYGRDMEDKMKRESGFVGLLVLVGLMACNPTVKVEAPDKPIVVNLNVKVKHEIQKDLDTTMKSNNDIF